MLDDRAAVDLLRKMVGISSLTGQEEDLAGLLAAVMARGGLTVERDEVGNVLGTVGPAAAERTVVILGHMDTVPGHVPVEIRDGKLYGRGAVDAKGPLAAAIVAAIRTGSSGRTRITMIGAVQEEGPSVGARHLAECFPPPDHLIIAEPGGWDAVVLGYKGSQRFEATWRQPMVHTSVPEPTSCERLVRFWNDLVQWCGTRSAAARSEFERLRPALIAMYSGSDGFTDTAGMTIGLRLPPGLAIEDVRSGVRVLLPDAQYDFHPGEEAVRAGKNNALVAAFLRGIRAEGGRPRFKVKTGTSDMNVVTPVWGCPVLAYGPGDAALDHTPEEHVPVEEYLRGIRVLESVLREL